MRCVTWANAAPRELTEPRIRQLFDGIWRLGLALLMCAVPSKALGQSISDTQVLLDNAPLTLELGVVSAALAWSFPTSARTAYGLSAGLGAQVGVMLAADPFSSGDYGADRTFAEIAHGALFMRHQVSPRIYVEGGPRFSWLYHPPTEEETYAWSAYASAFMRVASFRRGVLSLGPRLQFGRMAGTSGRSAWNLGLIPIAGRISVRR